VSLVQESASSCIPAPEGFLSFGRACQLDGILKSLKVAYGSRTLPKEVLFMVK
jgi:hypothetical protein